MYGQLVVSLDFDEQCLWRKYEQWIKFNKLLNLMVQLKFSDLENPQYVVEIIRIFRQIFQEKKLKRINIC